MRIAIAQLNTRAGDFENTATRMLTLSATAAEQGADLLVFSLAALTGPLPPDYATQEGYLIDVTEVLERIANAAACPCIVPVVTDREGDPFAEAMLLRKGEVVPLRLFSHLSHEGGAKDEGRLHHRPSQPAGHFLGEERHGRASTFEFADMRFGLAFTYDDLDALYDDTESLDAVLFLSSYGYALDDASSALGAALGESRFKSDAVALDSWLVAVGSVGGYGMQVFSGSSFVLTPAGELVASAPAFEEALVCADIDRTRHVPHEQAMEEEIYNRTLHLWEALVLGLHDYLEKSGHSDVALVVDGSLGSCVVAALATDAVGPTHVHALVAPFEGTGERANDAAELVSQLTAALRVSPEPLGMDSALLGDDEALRADVSEAWLAHMARRYDAVPLSCADKTFLALEANVVRCHSALLLPLGDVYRTDVIELAHLRNTISPVIPQEAFAFYSVPSIEGLDAAEPTPELRLKRIDVTLATHVEWERTLSDTVARQGERTVTEAILARLHQTELMRVAWPPYLMASSRTLFDARTPLGLAWHDRVRDQDERLNGQRIVERIASFLGIQPNAQEMPDMSAFLADLEAELEDEGLPEGIDRQEMESSLGELFGLLQDLAQSGGLTAEHPDNGEPPFGGPLGPLTWGSPFSEN